MEVYFCFAHTFNREHKTSGFLPLIIKCCSWFSVHYKDNCKFETWIHLSNVLRTSRAFNCPVNPFSDRGTRYLPAKSQSSNVAASYGFKGRICFPTSPLSVFITWQPEISKTFSHFSVWISTGTHTSALYFNTAKKVSFSREIGKFINFGIAQTLPYSTSNVNLSLKKYLWNTFS